MQTCKHSKRCNWQCKRTEWNNFIPHLSQKKIETCRYMRLIMFLPELRQLKNGLASMKNMLVLKLTRFFPYRVCRWAEKRGNFKASMFFTEASPILYFFSFKNGPKTNYFALNIDFLLINFASIVAKSKVKSIDCVNPLKKNVIFFNVSKN